MIRLNTAATAATVVLLAGCAAGGTPKFDPNASIKAQAAQFMDVKKKGDIAKLDKIAVTSCNVMVGSETGASASTRPGIGEDRSTRGEISVSTLYVMQGVDNAQLQALTTTLCDAASAKLAAAGFKLVAQSELDAQPQYQKMHASGQATPYTMKQGNGTLYTVFTPAGQKVVDQTFMSTGGAFANVFKAMGSGGPGVAEAALIDELQTAAVHINILVDFAAITDIKSTGSKVGETAYNVFAGLTQVAAAVSGGTGAGMVSTSKYGVAVDYPAYQAATVKLSNRFMDMAVASVR